MRWLLGFFGFTTKGEMIAVGINRHEISHPIVVVAWLGFHDRPFRSDFNVVAIDLVAEQVDSPATDRALVDTVTAKVNAHIAKLHAGIIAEAEIFGKTEDVLVVAQRRFDVRNLED